MKLDNNLKDYIKELRVLRTLPENEVIKTWKKAVKGDRKAKQKLIESNLRLVIPIAKRYQKPGVELLDLIEEGNIGLMHAIDKFKPSKKTKFSTYATYWIEQHITRSVEESSKTIRIPPYIWDNLRKWVRNWEALHAQLGRYPTVTEMTHKLQLSEKQVKNIIDTSELFQSISSLETPIDGNDELFIKDTVRDKTSATPDQFMTSLKFNDELDKALAKLNPREQNIVELRYGFKGKKEHTLESIGIKLHLSKERVRQLEKRALYKLRWIAERMKLI